MLTADALFLNVFHMSLSASWLILAVCLLRLLLKKAPKSIRCLLWGLVALRLLCPFSIESAYSLIPTRSKIITDELLYAEDPRIETGVAMVDKAIAPVVENSLTPQPGASVNPIQVWLFAAEVLWGIGIGVMLLYAVGSRYLLGRRVAVSVPDEEERVRLCDEIDTPFILGMIRPHIYLPSSLGEEEKKYVLAHERAHIQRKDHSSPQSFRNVSTHDTLRKTFDDRRLTDPRLADENRIVFGLSRKYPDDIADFRIASYYRIELAGSRKLRQVAAVFLENVFFVVCRLKISIHNFITSCLQTAKSMPRQKSKSSPRPMRQNDPECDYLSFSSDAA